MNKIITISFAVSIMTLVACGDSTATSAENLVDTAKTAQAKVESVKTGAAKVVEGAANKGATTVAAAPATAAPTKYVEGTHYVKIDRRVNLGLPADKIAVQEIFWYGCPHCASLEPSTKAWNSTKPADVEFIYVPAALNPQWRLHAKAFYAGQKFGLTEATHENLLKAIHQQGRRINDENSLVRFFSAAGADSDEFRAAMNSEEIEKKVNVAASYGQRYRLTGVPALIVDGQYRVLLFDGLRGYPELYEVVDFLVNKVRSDRSAG